MFEYALKLRAAIDYKVSMLRGKLPPLAKKSKRGLLPAGSDEMEGCGPVVRVMRMNPIQVAMRTTATTMSLNVPVAKLCKTFLASLHEQKLCFAAKSARSGYLVHVASASLVKRFMTFAAFVSRGKMRMEGLSITTSSIAQGQCSHVPCGVP